MAGSSTARIKTPYDPARDATLLRAIREAISAATLRAEQEAVPELRAFLEPVARKLEAARGRAIRWVEVARADKRTRPFAESLMEQFPLDSAQGRALMSLAEALLRTPDPERADQLIAERLAEVRSGGRHADEPMGGGASAHAPSGGAVSGADRPKDNLLLRVGFALLGGVSRLLPEVADELSGRFSAASLTKPALAPVVRAT